MLVALECLIEGGQKIPKRLCVGLGIKGGGSETLPKKLEKMQWFSSHRIISSNIPKFTV